MDQSVVNAHSQLYHYTTAAGLKGIIETQQLRATNISYLNDAEEHIGFFDRRLPQILEKPIKAAVKELAKTTQGKKAIDELGGIDKSVYEEIKVITKIFRNTTLKLNKPYVTAFCSVTSNSVSDDGLLSQWRGYGTDGGYAIVFETKKLQQLLEGENNNFHYQTSVWGDVEYYDQDNSQKAAHPETLKWEATLQESIRSFILTGKKEEIDGLAEPITFLSCMHKHIGFREEAEVRIVAIPANAELFELAQKSGEKRPRKPIEFAMKNGILVPYIMLFGRQFNGKLTRLPISKIIVGPHPERDKRRKAVELMLEQHEIKAEVLVSDIPYLGR